MVTDHNVRFEITDIREKKTSAYFYILLRVFLNVMLSCNDFSLFNILASQTTLSWARVRRVTSPAFRRFSRSLKYPYLLNNASNSLLAL